MHIDNDNQFLVFSGNEIAPMAAAIGQFIKHDNPIPEGFDKDKLGALYNDLSTEATRSVDAATYEIPVTVKLPVNLSSVFGIGLELVSDHLNQIKSPHSKDKPTRRYISEQQRIVGKMRKVLGKVALA